jgi:hypothetical protein
LLRHLYCGISVHAFNPLDYSGDDQ